MDYKQLNQVVSLMGGKLSYSLDNGWHEFKVIIGIRKDSYRYANYNYAKKAIENYLKETYPIQYANALNQLNLK